MRQCRCRPSRFATPACARGFRLQLIRPSAEPPIQSAALFRQTEPGSSTDPDGDRVNYVALRLFHRAPGGPSHRCDAFSSREPVSVSLETLSELKKAPARAPF